MNKDFQKIFIFAFLIAIVASTAIFGAGERAVIQYSSNLPMRQHEVNGVLVKNQFEIRNPSGKAVDAYLYWTGTVYFKDGAKRINSGKKYISPIPARSIIVIGPYIDKSFSWFKSVTFMLKPKPAKPAISRSNGIRIIKRITVGQLDKPTVSTEKSIINPIDASSGNDKFYGIKAGDSIVIHNDVLIINEQKTRISRDEFSTEILIKRLYNKTKPDDKNSWRYVTDKRAGNRRVYGYELLPHEWIYRFRSAAGEGGLHYINVREIGIVPGEEFIVQPTYELPNKCFVSTSFKVTYEPRRSTIQKTAPAKENYDEAARRAAYSQIKSDEKLMRDAIPRAPKYGNPWKFTQIIGEFGKESVSAEDSGSDPALSFNKFSLSAHINASHKAFFHLNWTRMSMRNTYTSNYTESIGVTQLRGGALLNLGGVFVAGGEISHSSTSEAASISLYRNYGYGLSLNNSNMFLLVKAGFGSYFTDNMWYVVGVFGVQNVKSKLTDSYVYADYDIPLLDESRTVYGAEAGILVGRAPSSKFSLYLTGNYLKYKLLETTYNSTNSAKLKNGSSWNAKALFAFKVSRVLKLAVSATYTKQDFEFGKKQYHRQTHKSINAGFVFSF